MSAGQFAQPDLCHPRTKANPNSEEQRAVIEAPHNARILVLAGPGTGKTETVAHRLAWLLSNDVGPAQIAVLSFSRNAVKTLTNRIDALAIGSREATLEELRHLSIRTFDSWTFRQLRQLNHPVRELLAGRNRYEENIRLLVRYMRGERRSEIRANLAHLRHVIVDEFQDLSGARGALVLELLDLVCPVNTLDGGFTVLGDENQAIYGFSLDQTANSEFGSLSSQVLFKQLRTARRAEIRELTLTHNYRTEPRLAKVIAKAHLILSGPTSSAMKLRALQKLVGHVKPLDPHALKVTAHSEGRRTSVGLLCRTNGEALRLGMTLYGDLETPPPIRINLEAGSPPASLPAWIGATLGQCKGSQVDRVRFERIYQVLYGSKEAASLVAALEIPGVEIAWTILKHISAIDGGADAVDLGTMRERLTWPDQLPDDATLQRSLVTVTTVHQSKGMEYDTVVILSSPHNTEEAVRDQDKSAAQKREEANVLFVAISRAANLLGRIDPEGIHPIYARTFANETRSRWCQWRNGRLTLEAGVAGDIDTASFVSRGLHGTDSAVKELQTILAKKADSLPGRKVVLCKKALPGKLLRFVYDIHLQEDGKPGLRIGRTTAQFPHDVSTIVSPKGFSLPTTFYNARISDVITCTSQTEAHSDGVEPWATSGLWLGVTLHGLAAGQTFRRKA